MGNKDDENKIVENDMKDLKNQNDESNEKIYYMPILMCLGLSIGLAIGKTTGMIIGLSLGVTIGAILDNQ